MAISTSARAFQFTGYGSASKCITATPDSRPGKSVRYGLAEQRTEAAGFVFDSFRLRSGTVPVGLCRSIGALPSTSASRTLAARRLLRLTATRSIVFASIDAKDAAVIADAARTTPNTLTGSRR
ncbi:hypothetical protein [Streptomyces fradiae]|uniref:hypothetical protein n=1 Tax=Streptomyces fradiae TaxID=1906 RepID=UPI00398606B3